MNRRRMSGHRAAAAGGGELPNLVAYYEPGVPAQYAACLFPDPEISGFNDGTAGTKATQTDTCTPQPARGTFSYNGETLNFDATPSVPGWTVLEILTGGFSQIWIQRNTNGSTSPLPVSNIDLEYIEVNAIPPYIYVTLPEGTNAGKWFFALDGVQVGDELDWDADSSAVETALSGIADLFVEESGPGYWGISSNDGQPISGTVTAHSSLSDPLQQE